MIGARSRPFLYGFATLALGLGAMAPLPHRARGREPLEAGLCESFYALLEQTKQLVLVTPEQRRGLQARLVSRHAAGWIANLAHPPEADLAHGMTELREAIAGYTPADFHRLIENGKRLRNSTYLVSIPARAGPPIEAILKYPGSRDLKGQAFAAPLSTVPRFEMLAYALDRYLGTNLVPPALRANGGGIVQLKVPLRASSLGEMLGDGSGLMDLSSLALLDTLFDNHDRGGFLGVNLFRNDRRIVGLDFDMSHVNDEMATPVWKYGYAVPTPNAGSALRRRILGPGVYYAPVLARLKQLSAAQLTGFCEEAGFSDASTAAITREMLRRRDEILSAIERWKTEFGAENVVIPAMN